MVHQFIFLSHIKSSQKFSPLSNLNSEQLLEDKAWVLIHLYFNH